MWSLFHKAERERSDDNDARAFLLSNRLRNALKRSTSFPNRLEFCHQRNRLREVSQPVISRCDSRLQSCGQCD